MYTVTIKSKYGSNTYLAVFNSKDAALNDALNLLERHFAVDDNYIDDGEIDDSSEEEKIFIGGPYKEGTNLLIQRGDQKTLKSLLRKA
jgi:hypothetical protein